MQRPRTTATAAQLPLIELPPPSKPVESVARQRARLSMTARCCNQLLAELDRVAERERERDRERAERERAERLASLYEAAIRNAPGQLEAAPRHHAHEGKAAGA